MRVRSMLLAATSLALVVGALPAQADDGPGYNNGDQGFVSTVLNTVNDVAEADCIYHQQPLPNSNNTVDSVEGHANFGGTDATNTISVVVRCVLEDNVTHVKFFDETHGTAGPQGVWAPPNAPRVFTSTVHPIKVCVAFKLHKENGTDVGDLNSLSCR